MLALSIVQAYYNLMLERILMNRLPLEMRAQILALLVEVSSINATCRISGVAKNTILKLLRDVGAACADYQNGAMHGLALNKVQCDEIWSFVGMKQKNVPDELQGELGYGDVYT